MNLIRQKNLKNKMLEVNPSFMRNTFDSGIDRANEARREMEFHFNNLKHDLNDENAMNLERSTNSMALGINHAAFTYDPNDPNQVKDLNDIISKANDLIQNYGEYLNTVIHNYPRIGNSFDHIYDIMEDYYSINQPQVNTMPERDIHPDQTQELQLQNKSPELSYNDPSLQYGPRPGF